MSCFLCYQNKENLAGGDHKPEKDIHMLKTKLGLGLPVPLKDSGNVAITLTLTSAAAEDIRGVLSAVADLLKISTPLSFEITERTTTPPSQKFGLYKKGSVVMFGRFLKCLCSFFCILCY